MITAKLKKRPTLKAIVTKPYQGKGYAEGYEDGLEKGYANGEADANAAAEAHNAEILTDCNEVLPTKGVETADTLEAVSQRIGEIEVTEDLLRYCNQPNFCGLGVFDKEQVVLNLDYTQTLYRMTYQGNYKEYSNTKVKHLVINCKQQILNTQQVMIVGDYVLERVTLNADISKSTSAMQMFRSNYALRVIDGTPLDLSSSTNNTNIIMDCGNLEEIRFAPNSIKVAINFPDCAKLSQATVNSIIDGLAEGATGQTLTLHSAVVNKLEDWQKAEITRKKWELVY